LGQSVFHGSSNLPWFHIPFDSYFLLGNDSNPEVDNNSSPPSIDGAIQLIKRVVDIFDDDKKGFVSDQDIRRVLANCTGLSYDSSELVKVIPPITRNDAI
jgi:hypothetical protein